MLDPRLGRSPLPPPPAGRAQPLTPGRCITTDRHRIATAGLECNYSYNFAVCRRTLCLRIVTSYTYASNAVSFLVFFLRRCPNAETLSRHESPDCGAKRGDYACAVTPIQPMPPRGELLN
ncbi:hypothetical protein EVAR_94883_1 [Eumeta japonica]|uniref:Uncharacterized protein n=1 Tax=Eumeta variegata TaxID=151549 RepID=A0A4C1VAR2_EUMVA|nr:hypothetical protein EVAR_94883_1 [Eumeta japonica]